MLRQETLLWQEIIEGIQIHSLKSECIFIVDVARQLYEAKKILGQEKIAGHFNSLVQEADTVNSTSLWQEAHTAYSLTAFS